MKKTVNHILFISSGYGLSPVLSGGEVRLHAIIKRAPKNFKTTLLTSEGGTKAALENGISIRTNIITAKSSFIFKREYSGIQRFWGYFISAITGYNSVKKLKFDTVYTSSDSVCDIIPAYLYKRNNKSVLWCAMLHHRYMNPFKRPGNKIVNLILYMLQDFSFRLIAKKADIAFVLDTPEGESISSLLTKYGFDGKVIKVFNGTENAGVKNMPAKKDKNLAVYVGGLRASKGLYDIVPAWKAVSENSIYKLRIIGSGSAKDNQYLERTIKESGLSKSAKMLGYLKPDELKNELSKASVFFFPSREEGWGISVVDAISYGLRPVVYELPAYRHFRHKILTAPCFDTEAFAALTKKAFKLGPLNYDKNFIRRFSWDTIARKEYKIITGELKCLRSRI